MNEQLCNSQAACLSVAARCCQALVGASEGKIAEACKLASSLPLDFPWLWAKEGDYNEEEALSIIARVRQALLGGLAPPCEGVGDPADAPWRLIRSGEIQCALTVEGDETGLGAIVCEGVEVRSFGPQALPLSRPNGFGIRPAVTEGSMWASCSAVPEVWFQIQAREDKLGLFLDFSFFGLSVAFPLALVFYVKAKSARVGRQIVAPRSLQRYVDGVLPVVFGDRLKIEADWEGRLQVVPLAGFGGFWNCEYLAAFEIPPHYSKCSLFFGSI